jgi:GNAT superfamily N-acetyltransferase
MLTVPEEVSVERIVVRPRTEEDDDAIVAIRNRLSAPLLPTSVDDLRMELMMIPERARSLLLVAERDGAVIGQARAGTMFWTEGNAVLVDIGVQPEWQACGAGSMLYGHVLAQVEEWGVERMYAYVREGDDRSLGFAERRGFVHSGDSIRFSMLEVSQARLDGYEGLADRLGAEGIRVTTLAEIGDADDTLRRLHQVSMVTARDEPGPESFGQPYEEWRHALATVTGVSPGSIWVALHGDEIIGLSMLRRVDEDNAFHFAMGVLREYRGRGVARLIKVRQVEWARENGVRFLHTGNSAANPRMYDINVRLGYKPLPAQLMLVRVAG